MYDPLLLLSSFFAAFLNTAEAMEVEAFLEGQCIEKRIKGEVKEKRGSLGRPRGRLSDLSGQPSLGLVRGEDHAARAPSAQLKPAQDQDFISLPKSDAHHVRTTNNGVIAPEQVRAEIKDLIKHVVGDKHGPDAALKAVVVGNVAYQECMEFLEKTLKVKVGEEPSPGNKPGKNHGDVHEDELEQYFKATLMHHETPEV
ncbi:hypothetical protein DdX_16358 [Ditylenchus destructor]|uniref:Uncharacterized protein n=1 Tax=Ditylenchus destructor TaxID=166010 RepID=A0AAD4MR58_9BILA|nr:hypothetical protein DdX_16358 [Ditylenchus destructor]